jgi:hypothetical protein
LLVEIRARRGPHLSQSQAATLTNKEQQISSVFKGVVIDKKRCIKLLTKSSNNEIAFVLAKTKKTN